MIATEKGLFEVRANGALVFLAGDGTTEFEVGTVTTRPRVGRNLRALSASCALVDFGRVWEITRPEDD